jgi:hypothetical protein
MIKKDLLTEKDKGRWVLYRSSGGDKVQPGRIKSWNHATIFVVYAVGDDNWDHYEDYTGASTDAGDLEFIGV